MTNNFKNTEWGEYERVPETGWKEAVAFTALCVLLFVGYVAVKLM